MSTGKEILIAIGFSLIVIGSASTNASPLPVQCVMLFSETKLMSPIRKEFLGQIESILSSILGSSKIDYILQALKKPTWNEYNEITTLISLLKNNPADEANILNATEREQLADVTKAYTSGIESRLADFLPKLSEPQTAFRYKRHLDYHRAFFKLLADVNTLINLKIFPLPDMSIIESKEKLIAHGEKVIQKLEGVVDTTFPLSGHTSLKAFEDYAKNFDERFKDLINMVNNHVVIALHRPERGRFWILLAGFQNQRITGSSNGCFYDDSTPGNVSGRDQAEANLTLTDIESYIPLSGSLKPNYAEAIPDTSITDIRPGNVASHYGSDLWIIKSSVAESRATFTPKDSLSPGFASPRNNSFDDIFIPWKYRTLMAPYAFQNVIGQKVYQPGELPDGFRFDNLIRWGTGYSYFEVQIFGPVTLDDVQALRFRGIPPEPELYKLLISKNIEVWDERQWPPKKYIPTAEH